MKKQDLPSVPATGGASLLVIFGVLCLVLLSLLSLNTALAEQRLSEASAGITADWYAADFQAQKIFARLRSGQQVAGVERTEDGYVYSVPISDRQTLFVFVKERDGSWEVLRWQTVSHPEDGENPLPVWQGLKERE